MIATSCLVANVKGKTKFRTSSTNAYTPYVFGSNDLRTFTNLSQINVNTISISGYDYVVVGVRNYTSGNRIWFE